MGVMLDITALIAPDADRDVPRHVPRGRRTGPRGGGVERDAALQPGCRHCYSDSTGRVVPELSTDEAADMVADLAAFGCPTLVVSGGEPLLRPDVLDLIAAARRLGLDVVLSTNGTQVTVPVAQRLARLGLRRVVVGLDGIGVVHDAFRGRRAAFAHALRGIRLLRRAGVPVGVETTIAHSILPSLSGILALVEAEGAESVCFRHLVPAGRGWTRPGDRAAHRPDRPRRALHLGRAGGRPRRRHSGPDGRQLRGRRGSGAVVASARPGAGGPRRAPSSTRRGERRAARGAAYLPRSTGRGGYDPIPPGAARRSGRSASARSRPCGAIRRRR